MKRRVRTLLAACLYYSGLLWLYAAIKLRNRAVVLMYHRVLPPDADSFSHAGIVVTPATFERHMRFVARHFRVLDLKGFRAELEGPAFGRRTCLVTFDDGWADNYTHAFPIIRKHRVPIALFVATGYIGTETTFWQERLTRLLYTASRARFARETLARLGSGNMVSLDDKDARARAREIVTTLKRAGDHKAVERALSELEAANAESRRPAGLGDDRFMDWNQVRELVASGLVQVGSHTHSHEILPAIGYERTKEEFTTSLRVLREQGLPETRECAYPNGFVDDEVARAARDAGLSLAFVTRNKLVEHGDDRFHLRRVNIHEQATASNAELLCLVLGVF
jgi:peptidoglycan/xylan/chitin deacetylase (PgdA/CDA1 family)